MCEVDGKCKAYRTRTHHNDGSPYGLRDVLVRMPCVVECELLIVELVPPARGEFFEFHLWLLVKRP
ncbi:hypothetical protein D3C87_1285740 [compost metagenome]